MCSLLSERPRPSRPIKTRARDARGDFYTATEHISVFILPIYCQQTVRERRL